MLPYLIRNRWKKLYSYVQVPTISALYTKSHFRLSPETVEAISLHGLERNMKQNPLSIKAIEKASSSLVDLTGDDCKYEIDKSKIWITCCGFILTTQERNTLVNGGELCDRIYMCSIKETIPRYRRIAIKQKNKRIVNYINCVNAVQIILEGITGQ